MNRYDCPHCAHKRREAGGCLSIFVKVLCVIALQIALLYTMGEVFRGGAAYDYLEERDGAAFKEWCERARAARRANLPEFLR